MTFVAAIGDLVKMDKKVRSFSEVIHSFHHSLYSPITTQCVLKQRMLNSYFVSPTKKVKSESSESTPEDNAENLPFSSS